MQLRLYLGTPEAGTLSDQPYDTADLRVDGDRWELVRGGTASCADAESALAPVTRRPVARLLRPFKETTMKIRTKKTWVAALGLALAVSTAGGVALAAENPSGWYTGGNATCPTRPRPTWR